MQSSKSNLNSNKTWHKVLFGIVVAIIAVVFICFMYAYRSLRLLDRAQLVSENVNEIIPFHYSESHHMLVDVRINGSQQTYPFLLDSGAASFIFGNTLEQFDLPDIGNGIAVGTGGGVLFPDIYRIDQLSLGSIEFANVSAQSIDKLPISCSDEIFGILGKEAMQHLVWQIDFEKEQLHVVSDKSQLTFGTVVDTVPLKESKLGHHLYVATEWGKDSITSKKDFIVDLGCNEYAAMGGKHLKNTASRTIDIMGNSSVGLDGENTSKATIQELTNFRIGKTTLPQFTVSAGDATVALLGLGFLRNYKTTISWKDDQLWLEPYAEQYFGAKGYGYGARYDPEANALIVKSVHKGFPADEAGLRPNARIISLNGTVIDSEAQYCAFEYSGDTVEVVYEQDGRQQTAVLEKRDYFPLEPTEELLSEN
ncbi:MAG: aspartyl protease family protein [Bacteroidota bacterium]